ncbi:MAG: hypothetical protein WHS64_03120 [Fervidobacterium sp.]|uniref:hypothetical protein n=1 Tax=Fervidobacterium TaxID=2422 RepID=UPI0030B755FF
MFLVELTESEKKNFLELVNIIATCDGEFSEAEKKLFDAYRREMNLPEEDYAIQGKGFEDIMSELQNSNRVTKKKIFVELLALTSVDNKYLRAEEIVIKELARRFEIGEEDYINFLGLVVQLKELYKKVQELVER